MQKIYQRLASKLEGLGYARDELVFGVGDETSPIVLLGEAPGKDEVAQGRPFVGRAGKNLEEFLAFTGLRRERLFVTNVVKFRPCVSSGQGRLRNRPPTAQEIALCRSCLEEELAAIAPRLVVTLGNTALGALAEGSKIGQVHGRALEIGRDFSIFPLYHPASVIYNPKLREVYLADLNSLRVYLAEQPWAAE